MCQVFVLVNADILLFDDLLQVTHEAAAVWSDFLIVGRRSNMNASLTARAQRAASASDFRRLRFLARRHAPHHTRWALDYFAMTRGILGKVSRSLLTL